MKTAQEEHVEDLGFAWETARAFEYGVEVRGPERMQRSLFAPRQGGNVPKPNLFEQYRASGSTCSFADWAAIQKAVRA